MFGFNRVLNATTGVRYTIQRAALASEELDTQPNGVNIYEIDLEPEDEKSSPIYGVTLAIYNFGHAALSRNLDPKGSEYKVDPGEADERIEVYLDDALIEGKTLIVTTKPAQREQTTQEKLAEADYLNNMADAMEALEKVWKADGVPPWEMVQRLQDVFRERLPKLVSPEDLASLPEHEYAVRWCGEDGNQQERYFGPSLEGARLEKADLVQKYDGVKIVDLVTDTVVE